METRALISDLASILLLGALTCVIASIFAENRYRIHLWIVGAAIAFLLGVAAFAIYAIRMPKPEAGRVAGLQDPVFS